jgi:hypothetical protein
VVSTQADEQWVTESRLVQKERRRQRGERFNAVVTEADESEVTWARLDDLKI